MIVVLKEFKRFNGEKKRNLIVVYRYIKGFLQEVKIDLCYVASVSKGWNDRDYNST